jgi:hypothetical protein
MSASEVVPPPSVWRHLVEALPMRTALLAVGVVWVFGCAWSFQEQSAFAASRGFAFPHLLPLVIDGFAVAAAGVSWAASLDARAAVPARLATLIAVGGSAASNGTWAWLRTTHVTAQGAAHDVVTVVLGVAVPIAANLAFEVLLSELRRQVQRRRGMPALVVVPYPRLVRVALAPVSTFRVWRALVLELTALDRALPAVSPEVETPAVTGGEAGPNETPADLEPAVSDHQPDDAESWEDEELTGDEDEEGLEERARKVIAGSLKPLGRRQLARQLNVTEHAARQLLAQVGPPTPARDVAEVSVGLYALNGSEGGR